MELAFVESGAGTGTARYRALPTAYGPAGFPEGVLNEVGYGLLRRGNTAEAIAAFALNVEAFPRSANTHDSLGEAYAAAGDTGHAIASYEESLRLNPRNANATKKLEELRAKR